MKIIKIFLLFFALVPLPVALVAAQINITDADAVFERDLQSVNIPTQAMPLANVFIINEDAVSAINLSPVSISTQAVSLAELFVINQDAVLAKGLVSVNTGTQARPVTKVFIINTDAVLIRDLVNLDGTTPSVGPSTTTSFTLSLDDGLNMCSLPLRSNISLTARSFAQQLGATMVIRYDTQQDEFVPFVPEVFAGNGFAIDGGQGYIVNMLSSREVTFTGTAWSNAPAKSAPSKPTRESHWAFAVCGAVYDEDMLLQGSDMGISVENHRTGNTAETWVGRLENGRYAIAFVDQNRKDVVDQGDVLGVRLRDTRTGAISKLITHTVTPLDIMRSYVELPMRLDYFTPEKNALLQNYPNPFNPDTWIPYQLSEDSHLVIKIHTTTGQLIRTLDLGHKNAGFYENRERAAHWDGRNEVGEQVASGIYFYSIKAGSFTGTGKMTVAR